MKFNKKTLGWVILILALFFISPIPGPDDLIGLELYSMYSGVNVDIDNISEIYLDYFIFSTMVGILLLVLAMNLLGWSRKKLFKKLDLGHYNLAVGLSFFVVVAMAFFNLTSYSYLLILPIIYYFYKKDISESIALGLSSLILIAFGFKDLMGFILNRISIPEVLLLSNPVIEFTSKNLGFEVITSSSLIISVGIGFLIVFLLAKVLGERF